MQTFSDRVFGLFSSLLSKTYKGNSSRSSLLPPQCGSDHKTEGILRYIIEEYIFFFVMSLLKFGAIQK